MKKYFFGLVALTLAVGFSSFTLLSKRATTTFNYTAPGGSYSQTDVQTVGNWASGSITCTGIADKACIIVVDNQNLDQNGNLDPAKVTINAADPNSNGTYEVSSLSLSVSTGSGFTNKQ
jgi:hypothetical protein